MPSAAFIAEVAPRATPGSPAAESSHTVHRPGNAASEDAGETTRAVDRVVRLFVERRQLAERNPPAAAPAVGPPRVAERCRRFCEPLLPGAGPGLAPHAPQRGHRAADHQLDTQPQQRGASCPS